MALPFIDILVFFVFTAGTIFFGASFFKRKSNAAAYTSGEKKLAPGVVALSIFATYVSSISFLALPGKAYQSNWNAFVFSLSIPLAAFFAVRFFVPLYREINSISAYHFLEQRFGTWARIYAASCYILTQIMRTGAILLLLALPLKTSFGWGIHGIIIITGLAVTAYSMLGGIKAVIWTDAIQAVILILGAVIVALYLSFSLPQGPGQVFRIASEYHKFSLGSFGANLSQSTFWAVLVYGFFINLQNFGIDQNYIQRYMTTSSEAGAKKSTWMGSLLYIPVSFVFFYIGTALFVYYKVNNHLLPPDLLLESAADQVFPYFIVHGLPLGFTGLLLAAVFAAGMSTISTSINSSATILLTDFYKKLRPGPASDRTDMNVLYLSSLVVGLTGSLVALALVGVQSILDTWWALASVFSGGMLGLFLLAFMAKKAQRIHAMIGVAIGVLTIIWLALTPFLISENGWFRYRHPFHSNLTIVIGTTVIFLVGFLLSYWIPKKKA